MLKDYKHMWLFLHIYISLCNTWWGRQKKIKMDFTYLKSTEENTFMNSSCLEIAKKV